MYEIDTWDMIIRVAVAAGVGFMLGIDRDVKNKPIDFRAYIIVCVASALLAMMSIEIIAGIPDDNHHMNVDPHRIVQGVLTGIAFLGAGAIIKYDKNHIMGTTTGASIWAAGALGIAIGYGLYLLTLIATVAIVMAMILMGWLTPVERFLGQDPEDEDDDKITPKKDGTTEPNQS